MSKKTQLRLSSTKEGKYKQEILDLKAKLVKSLLSKYKLNDLVKLVKRINILN